MLSRGRLPDRRPIIPPREYPLAASWAVLTAAGLALATIDRMVPGIGMGPAYIPLIVLAGWRLGPAVACGVALAAALLNVLPALPEEAALPPAVAVARAFLRLGTYAFVVFATCTLRRAYDREREAARQDALTGALNRIAFEDHAQAVLSTRRGGRHVVVMADLDGFKALNDREGHAAGDEVLRRVVAAAGATLSHGERIARLGGDEFAFLLQAETDALAAVRAEALHQSLVHALAGRGVGASMGAIVLAAGSGESLAAALRASDALMYAAKAGGKGACASAACRRRCGPPRTGCRRDPDGCLTCEPARQGPPPLAGTARCRRRSSRPT
ncbi:GGDEF domain-containing protein [Methylobacterium tardum]|uniref:GGDEF domain-containing protein n=1 Tax=Methylobacterium tardum TaxID=374432 RepID=UPI0036138847